MGAVQLEFKGTMVSLDWNQIGHGWYIGSYVRGDASANADVGPQRAGNAGLLGAGIYTREAVASVVAPILIALKTSRFRIPFIDPLKHVFGSSNVVPLHMASTNSYGMGSQYGWMVWNLCKLLGERPALLERLAEQLCMMHLVREMQANPLPAVQLRMGTRRESVQIRTAIQGAGYVHRLGGRPIPGDPLDSMETAIEKVRTRISSSPYSKGVQVDPVHVREILESEYFGVKPWPFAALVS